MKRIPFNINNYVLVEIFDWDTLYKRYGEDYVHHVIKTNQVVYEDKEYFRLQLWYAMKFFGSSLQNGSPTPIGTNIFFEVD